MIKINSGACRVYVFLHHKRFSSHWHRVVSHITFLLVGKAASEGASTGAEDVPLYLMMCLFIKKHLIVELPVNRILLGFVLSAVDLVPEECRTMLEDFCWYLLVITAHAQWDYG